MVVVVWVATETGADPPAAGVPADVGDEPDPTGTLPFKVVVVAGPPGDARVDTDAPGLIPCDGEPADTDVPPFRPECVEPIPMAAPAPTTNNAAATAAAAVRRRGVGVGVDI